MQPTEREESRARLSSYLSRRFGLTEPEARVRADELMQLTGARSGAALENVASHWWSFALRALLAVIIGILFLVTPGRSLAALVIVFGVWAFVDGLVELISAIALKQSWQLALAGIVGIAIGVLTFIRPGLTALALYAAVAVWTICRGILEIGVGIELRRTIQNESWMILDGILSIAIGVMLIVLPAAGVLTLAWLIGIYALVVGGFLFSLALRLRRISHPSAPHGTAPLPV
jgi:uncharacterized membrane protein HdeD (DUF308 family)